MSKVPRGKVELWLCNEVQESIKTVIHTVLMIYRWLHLESSEEQSQEKLVQAEKKVNWSRANENSNRSWASQWKLSDSKDSWCQVAISAEW